MKVEKGGMMFFNFLRGFVSFFKGESKPKLIKDLEEEHKQLLKLYQEIESKLGERDFEKVSKLLSEFFYKYKKHVLFEDNYLYEKLIKKYDGYESIVNFIKETKEEMDIITKMLERFLLIYKDQNLIKEKINEFTHDFIKLGEALKERIDFEESKLYVLY
jgi:regulator of sigma D